eukprot:TRINITY_DN5758_c0_g1_i1.p1 TRINITY_DN5758_c0_g1~~TRINITY_DN5758_c0_g1_i1.p1  ORF type:complete len:446 (-),score=43.37 TRINITY_DN5758_c0_g1_i1:342-1496(-)
MSSMETVISINTEKASAVFRIERFKFVFAANSNPKDLFKECRYFETNCVGPSELLRIGSLDCQIIVAWSCDSSGEPAQHSMLGVCVFDCGASQRMRHDTITLVNNDPRKSIKHSIFVKDYGWAWCPSPYATERKYNDGFVPLCDVLNPAKGWLSKDTGSLTIECQIEVAISRTPRLERGLRSTFRFRAAEIFSKQIGSLLDSGRHSDVTLVVGDEEIPAHSVILAAHSPVFEAVLSHGMKEGNERKVAVEGLDLSSVRRMLDFMYKGNLDLNICGEEVCGLLQAAHRYQVTPIVDDCVCVMKSQLTEKAAVKYLLQADLMGIESLKDACVQFIVSSGRRLAEVQRTEPFAQLVQKRPDLLVDLLAAVSQPLLVATKVAQRAHDS